MRKLGTGLFITAAFIGPGTVTTASLAGASFAFSLVWALLLSVMLTFALQEMASRLGLVSGHGLAEAMMKAIQSPLLKSLSVFIIVSAIVIGNAAYEAGNITGAALGLQQLMPLSQQAWVVSISLLAGVFLFVGGSKLLQPLLMLLVTLMSLLFLVTMLLAPVDWLAVMTGMLPSLPTGSELMVIALIGTTIVPYNLFLHASLVAAKSQSDSLDQQLIDNRWDTGLSIGIGGLITFAIMACAATALFGQAAQVSAASMAAQLTPVLGAHAQWFFGIGLFAAGLTSAITAPLAAAYVVAGLKGDANNTTSLSFRLTWLGVLSMGLVFSSFDIKPLSLILFAQATNGLLLPIVALFLLWACNQQSIMRARVNRPLTNFFAGLSVVLVSLLGAYKLFSLL